MMEGWARQGGRPFHDIIHQLHERGWRERDSGRSCLTIEVSSDTSVGPLAAVGQTALAATLKPLTVLCSGVGGGRLGAGDILRGERRREMVGG